MVDFDKNSSSSNFIAELQEFYHLAYSEESSQSPIYSDLKSIKQHFADKELYAMGGMKIVSRVRELRTDRQVAMAEMKKRGECTQEEIEQFLREARITAALDHPNIIPVYDIGLSKSGKPFFTMKFMRGESLKKIIRELLKANPAYTRKYTQNILLEIFLKVCEALAFAHSCGVVHLDIKPDNIILGSYGEVYICDWGIAKLLGSADEEQTGAGFLDQTILNDVTLSGTVKGTPGFMAPEQVNRRIGPKNMQTDIYAIGALLYAIMTFKKPFADLSVNEILASTMKGNLPQPKDICTINVIPESLNAICMKAMARKQADRYNALDELIADVRSYQAGFATEAEEVSFSKSFGLLLKRNKLVGSVILFSFFTVAIVAGVFGRMLERKEQQGVQDISMLQKLQKQELAKMHQQSLRETRKLESDLQKRDKEIAGLKIRLENIRDIIGDTVISLNITDKHKPLLLMEPTDIAGIVECGNWENVCKSDGIGTTNPLNLRDNYGFSTGVDFLFYCDGELGASRDLKLTGFNTDTAKANDKFMSTWSDFSTHGRIKFSRLNKFAAEYDVIVYSNRSDSYDCSIINLEGSSKFISNSKGATGPFKMSEFRREEKARQGGDSNYARYDGLTDDEFIIYTADRSKNWTPICGIQIVRRKKPLSEK